MMFTICLYNISCPYCGENSEIIVDGSVEFQKYTEDCSVCYQPIVIGVTVGYDETVKVVTRSKQAC